MSTYKKDVAKVIDDIEKVSGKIALQQCIVCRTPTQVTTLSDYGARCYRCYLDYCAGEQQGPHRSASIGDADWHDTQTQRDMRARVRVHVGNATLPRTPIEQHDDASSDKIDAVKRDTARRVAEYARKTGRAL